MEALNGYGKPTLSLQPGTEVVVAGKKAVITHLLDFESVLVTDAETGKPQRVRIADLQPATQPAAPTPNQDLQVIADEDWRRAQERFEIIRPLLDPRGRTRSEVASRAAQYGMHANTLYKWIALYEAHGRLSAFVPKQRADKGSMKLSPELETIVASAIETEYLNQQRKNASKVCREVARLCFAAGLIPPHCNTIRNRIASISAEMKLTRRHGRKAAEAKFSPIDGSFPGADFPLAVWQIDHTKVDIILVDDIHRRPIGKPWITLAIDVFSRMVAGFYVSFDPPGALSVGLCLAHAILPKDTWLAKRGVSSEWPIWGLPSKVHADNAKEFRGNMLRRACMEYGVDLEWRPVARPHYGAHIERLLGTFMQEVHALPGTTFSNPQERGDYNSEGKAVFTFSEFERWLTNLVVDIYHRKNHSTINMSPLDKLHEGIFGTKSRPGTGLPSKIVDEAKLRLDFMPFVERSIQDYGVVIDKVHYYHDVLRRWINASDPDNPKLKRQFMFRRDPRDISTIWFYDPELYLYYPIPYRDTSHPPISVWELREAMTLAKRTPDEATERTIFEAYTRLREIEEEAKGKTKAVRRAAQRRLGWQAAVKPEPLQEPPIDSPEDNTPTHGLVPFDEMDDMSDG